MCEDRTENFRFIQNTFNVFVLVHNNECVCDHDCNQFWETRRERMEREVTKKGQGNVEMELNFIQLF